MDMGTAPPFLVLLFLLPAAVSSSRDSFVAASNAAESREPPISLLNPLLVPLRHLHLGNYESVGERFDVHDDHLADQVYDSSDEVPSDESSGSDFFCSLCMEIAGKAKEGITDHNLMSEIDNLATALCTVVPPSDFEAKMKNKASCAMCHNILDGIDCMLGDADKKILLIVYLLKVCEAQTIVHHCKEYVFTFGPLLLSGTQMIARKDICYMLRICAEPRHLQAEPTDLFSKPENLNWMDV